MIAAVLFDWGETLSHSDWDEEIALAGNRAGLAALARDGLPTAEDVSGWFRGRLDELFPPDSLDEVDFVTIQRRCFVDLGSDIDDHELERYIEASYGYWSSRHKRPHPDAHALLDELRARGLRLGIVSNTATPLRLVAAEIEQEGLAARVDTVVFSCEIGKRKPHRAIFERALHELAVEPAATLFVGDRAWQDVWGASQLGMRTVQALWYHEDEHPLGTRPDFRVRAPLEILDIVGRG